MYNLFIYIYKLNVYFVDEYKYKFIYIYIYLGIYIYI